MIEEQLHPDRVKSVELLETYCAYCGDFNESEDHITPVSYNSGNRRLDRGPTVPCCMMCNLLAGDFVAFSVIEKAIYLEDQYQRKYKKYNVKATWTIGEINELGKTLQSYVKRIQFLRMLITDKLRNLDRVINGYPPVQLRSYKRVAFKQEFRRVLEDLQRHA